MQLCHDSAMQTGMRASIAINRKNPTHISPLLLFPTKSKADDRPSNSNVTAQHKVALIEIKMWLALLADHYLFNRYVRNVNFKSVMRANLNERLAL